VKLELTLKSQLHNLIEIEIKNYYRCSYSYELCSCIFTSRVADINRTWSNPIGISNGLITRKLQNDQYSTEIGVYQCHYITLTLAI